MTTLSPACAAARQTTTDSRQTTGSARAPGAYLATAHAGRGSRRNIGGRAGDGSTKQAPRQARRGTYTARCERCGVAVNPEARFPHECLLYPPYMMEKVYGPLWRSKFPEYRDGRRRNGGGA